MSPPATRPHSSSRGQRNDVVFTERLRVEVLVASEHAQAVLDAINEYSGAGGAVSSSKRPNDSPKRRNRGADMYSTTGSYRMIDKERSECI